MRKKQTTCVGTLFACETCSDREHDGVHISFTHVCTHWNGYRAVGMLVYIDVGSIFAHLHPFHQTSATALARQRKSDLVNSISPTASHYLTKHSHPLHDNVPPALLVLKAVSPEAGWPEPANWHCTPPIFARAYPSEMADGSIGDRVEVR